jgi:hypothetical protein
MVKALVVLNEDHSIEDDGRSKKKKMVWQTALG